MYFPNMYIDGICFPGNVAGGTSYGHGVTIASNASWSDEVQELPDLEGFLGDVFDGSFAARIFEKS